MRYAFLLLAMVACVSAVRAEAPLVFTRAIEMPRVEGRIDHLTMDTTAQRLFVAALANNTVEVIDLRTGKDERSLSGFHEPQGIGQPLDSRLVAVANGGTGDLVMFDRAGFRVEHTVVPAQDLLYVAVPHRGARRAEIRVYEAR